METDDIDDIDADMWRTNPTVETEWVYDNRNCRVTKVGGAHYCGYAQTALRGEYNMYLQKIEVHGGLTYGIDDDGYVGFDCGHAWDMCVDRDGIPLPNSLGAMFTRGEEANRWSPTDVAEEVERLADQLTVLEKDAGATFDE